MVKAFLLPTNEMTSSRFERLCDHLDVNEPEERYGVLGHVVQWYMRWCGDEEFDHGLFWDISLKRLGAWANWKDPQVFGNGLLKAGYVSDLTAVYPAELLRGHPGFVARALTGGVALDTSYATVHGRQMARALDLAFFLTDPQRRAQCVAALGCLDLPAWVPAGWVPGHHQVAPAVVAVGAEAVPGVVGSTPGAAVVGAPAVVAGAVSSIPAVVAGSSQAQPMRAVCTHVARSLQVAGSAAPAPLNVNVDVTNVREDLKKYVRRTETEPTSGPQGGAGRQRTGKPKSDEMGAAIREFKYSNPLLALCATDDSPNAVELWTAIVEKDLDFARSELGKAVETDERWAQIGNPAGWFMALVSKRLKHLGKTQRDGRHG